MCCECKKKKSNSCSSVELSSLAQAPNCNGIVPIQINGQWFKYNPSTCGGGSGGTPGNLSTLTVAQLATIQNLVVNGTADFNGNVDFEAGTTVDFTGVTVTGLTPTSAAPTVINGGTNVTVTGAGTSANPYIINANTTTAQVANIATNVTGVIGISQMKLASAGPMNGNSLTVTDSLATGTYLVHVNADNNFNGNLRVVKGVGSFTINSTAVESGVTFTYKIDKA